MKKQYILSGVNVNARLSLKNICECIEHGINELEIILKNINLQNKEDFVYFSENLELLKVFYEKLDRDMMSDNTPYIKNLKLPLGIVNTYVD